MCGKQLLKQGNYGHAAEEFWNNGSSYLYDYMNQMVFEPTQQANNLLKITSIIIVATWQFSLGRTNQGSYFGC